MGTKDLYSIASDNIKYFISWKKKTIITNENAETLNI